MFVNPEFTAVQFAPLLVERKTPPLSVPANILLPITANVPTMLFPNPEFTAVHFVPLLVERKTPKSVPANILLPLIAKA
jgi:hypothetical protein